MNTRSLKFQLIVWYAALLTGGFALLGVVTYLALQSSLTGALKETQLRRARQIAQLLREELGRENQTHVGSEIEARYAPGPNDRFVRITRRDGAMLYLSQAPKSQSFDPAALPPPLWPAGSQAVRQAPLVGARKMLLTAHALQQPGGANYLVETGAPMDETQSEL